MKKNLFPATVSYSRETNRLSILDQTRLPNEAVTLELASVEQVWEAIDTLRVRGAPAIGVAAAYGLCLAVRNQRSPDLSSLRQAARDGKTYLASARPTAVNLSWALERIERACASACAEPRADVGGAIGAMLDEADAIRGEDEAACRSIGENALPLLEGVTGVLTHCNAGALATSGYGTALAPVYCALERGRRIRVFADETRPLLQGARLTAWELRQAGVEVTLLCDGMCSSVMKNGWVQAVLVGCDRVAANGDTANKIGTSTVAIAAKYYGVPFYVCGPSSSVDLRCPTGGGIPIEMRRPEEITSLWYKKPMAPDGIRVFNPAFDVTDHSLIAAIVTEKGVFRPPFEQSLAALQP